MKLKTENEIEEMAGEWLIENNHVTMLGDKSEIFKAGYTQAQEDLIEAASENFEEWFKEYYRGGSIYEHCKEAWQSAKLSNAKKIEDLERENREMRDNLYYLWHWIEIGSKHENSKDLPEFMAEIRQRFNLDKEEV